MEHTPLSLFCSSAVNTNASLKLRSTKERERHISQKETTWRTGQSKINFNQTKLQRYGFTDQNRTFLLQLEHHWAEINGVQRTKVYLSNTGPLALAMNIPSQQFRGSSNAASAKGQFTTFLIFGWRSEGHHMYWYPSHTDYHTSGNPAHLLSFPLNLKFLLYASVNVKARNVCSLTVINWTKISSKLETKGNDSTLAQVLYRGPQRKLGGCSTLTCKHIGEPVCLHCREAVKGGWCSCS